MSWRDAPLYVESHDLALLVAIAADGTGDGTLLRCRERTLDLLEAVSLALSFPADRAAHLRRADEAAASLRVVLRVAQDAGALSGGRQREAARRLRVIGRMLGGWRKRVARSARGPPQ